jgi:GT2 family glycosyltransferase
MRHLSVVIPSRTTSNFTVSAAAVIDREPSARIILVDDAEVGAELTRRAEFEFISIVAGKKPFIFSRAVNMGIAAAGDDDVIVLGDDGILQTPGGFSVLQKAAEKHPEFGVIASTTNCVGNRNQLPKGIGFREEPRILCFVCVLIPRSTIEKVGLLDETYDCYSHQDDDYCYRVRQAGLKLAVEDGCFVDHNTLPSTFRGLGGTGNLTKGEAIFRQKWGSYPL